jgi:hypothetical protein
MAVAASAGGVIPGDETTLLIVLAILWAIAVGIGAFVTQSGTTAARNTVFAKPGARPPSPTARRLQTERRPDSPHR